MKTPATQKTINFGALFPEHFYLSMETDYFPACDWRLKTRRRDMRRFNEDTVCYADLPLGADTFRASWTGPHII